MSDARLRRDVVWNLVPVALLGVVGLGLNFLIAGWWGAAALGVFNLVSIAYFVAAVLGAWGLQYAVLRAVAAAPADEIAPIVVGALIPAVLLAAVATGVFLMSRVVIERLLGDAVVDGMLYAAPGLFCFAVNKVLLGVVNGLRRMRAFAIYTSLRYVLIALGLLLARATGVAPSHLAVLWTFTEGVLLVVLVAEVVVTVPLARGAGWQKWAREHLAYGGRGVAATLAYEINSKLDVWMLGALGVNTALVGVYSIAAGLNEGAMQLAVVVQNNVNPMLARALAAGDRACVEALVRRTRRWFVPGLAGACALGALLYPALIPSVLHDPAFHAGALPFAILMAGLALASAYLPFNQILLMANLPEWHTVLVVLVLALNFAAEWVFIPRLGLAGAALATSSAIVGQALLVRRLSRVRAGARI